MEYVLESRDIFRSRTCSRPIQCSPYHSHHLLSVEEFKWPFIYQVKRSFPIWFKKLLAKLFTEKGYNTATVKEAQVSLVWLLDAGHRIKILVTSFVMLVTDVNVHLMYLMLDNDGQIRPLVTNTNSPATNIGVAAL